MANMSKNLIVLRSPYGKVGQVYTITPCIDRSTGMLPSHIRKVDANGDMILSEKDKSSEEILISEIEPIDCQDGTTFDLNNPMQKARWEAIRNSALIAQSRDERDSKGELIIDGGRTKYGLAVLYIERPDLETKRKIERKKLEIQAMNYIFNDSLDKLKVKCRLLGKNMNESYDADIQDYLIDYAKRMPSKIIDLYTGTDMELRLLFTDAIQKGIIRYKDKVYMYQDTITLGITDDSVIAFFKQEQNAKILSYIKEEVYSDYNEKDKNKNKK